MDKKYGLSPTEYEIMEYLWSSCGPKYFKEILSYFNLVKNKDWKKQTLSTFLKILQERDLIYIDTSESRYQYYPACTREQHIHNWTVEICESAFDSSLGKLIDAYCGGEKLNKDAVANLKNYLKKYE